MIHDQLDIDEPARQIASNSDQLHVSASAGVDVNFKRPSWQTKQLVAWVTIANAGTSTSDRSRYQRGAHTDWRGD
jgi:hypothetical protein